MPFRHGVLRWLRLLGLYGTLLLSLRLVVGHIQRKDTIMPDGTLETAVSKRGASFWTSLGKSCTVGATVVIAVATVLNTCTADKQWNIMQRQLRITEYQQRPWLGVAQMDFKQEPRASMAQPDRKALALTMTFPIKNFGTLPAFAVNTSTRFILPFRTGDNERGNESCQQAEEATRSGRGQVIFPGSDFTSGVQETGISLEDMQVHSFVSIHICIFYHDTSRQMHYTKMGLVHTPITGVVTTDQEAN